VIPVKDEGREAVILYKLRTNRVDFQEKLGFSLERYLYAPISDGAGL